MGKTATTLNLAAALIRREYKVLAIDLDPQRGNLSQTLHADKTCPSMREVICDGMPLADVIQHTAVCDLAPATVDMSGIDVALAMKGTLAKDRKVKTAIAKLPEGMYDYILIDTPPALNLLTINAMVAADEILVVTEADINAMHGIIQLNEMVQNIRQEYSPDLSYAGILFAKFNARTNIGQDMKEVGDNMGQQVGARVFNTVIRASVAIPESITQGMDVFSYEARSNPAEDYEKFAEEFLQNSSATESSAGVEA